MIWVEATTTQDALLNESRIRPFLYSIVALTLVLNILVTGASKGLGKALAVAFAQAGVSGLALFARSDLSATKAAAEAAQRPGQGLKVLTINGDATKTANAAAAAKKAAFLAPPTAAEMKAARDARYAARKTRK